MIGQLQFQAILKKRFEEIRFRNEAYSLRSFARDLEQNPAALSQIMAGHRRVSKRLGMKVAQLIPLSPEERTSLGSAFDHEAAFKSTHLNDGISKINFNRDSIKQGDPELVTNWIYFAILSLSETTNFIDDPEWVSHRLGIDLQAAREALELLESQELLRRNTRGNLEFNGRHICTSDEAVDHALRKRHEHNLLDARKELASHDPTKRDFTYITMAIDPSRLPIAKKMIREFQNKLCSYLESGEQLEVYELCTQLFARTKIAPQGEKRN